MERLIADRFQNESEINLDSTICHKRVHINYPPIQIHTLAQKKGQANVVALCPAHRILLKSLHATW